MNGVLFSVGREQPSLPPQLVPGMWGYPGIRPGQFEVAVSTEYYKNFYSN